LTEKNEEDQERSDS